MNQWDPEGQRWVGSAPGSGSGQAPPDSDRARVLLVAAMVVLLVAVAGAALWLRAHDNSAEGQGAVISIGPEPAAPSPSDAAEPYGDDLNEPDPPESDSPSPVAEDEDPPGTEGPAETVQRYYDAINSADFATAWELGGKNFGASYSDYVSGFAETARDAVSVTDAQDDTVYVDITAYQTDGARYAYTGTYTVLDGVIVDADIERTS
ncbi:hypothetical protein [Streptomyces sp. NPDC056010]|uniref:hypothetical protein n=1 Tax=Streptomyces sp. NPDC056010 TaxID=3345679 RepID=UPI0035E0D7A3